MPSSKRKTIQQIDSGIFTAIAHPVRREILDRLADGDQTVTYLTQSFEITRSAVSQHLSILLDSGLVVRERRGREQYYQLRPENLNEVYRWISQYERFWPEKLDALENFLDTMADDAGESS